jgi:hypothetical protein
MVNNSPVIPGRGATVWEPLYTHNMVSSGTSDFVAQFWQRSSPMQHRLVPSKRIKRGVANGEGIKGAVEACEWVRRTYN